MTVREKELTGRCMRLLNRKTQHYEDVHYTGPPFIGCRCSAAVENARATGKERTDKPVRWGSLALALSTDAKSVASSFRGVNHIRGIAARRHLGALEGSKEMEMEVSMKKQRGEVILWARKGKL